MSQTIPQSSLPRIRELDALRGIAALMVVLYHFISDYPRIIPGVSALPFGFKIGQHGVELFFAISGFVIFMTLENTRTASDFIVSRFSRLYPTYWACMAITILVAYLMGPVNLQTSPSAIFVNLSMLAYFFEVKRVDFSYWSLTAELFFYGWMLLIWRLNYLKRIEWILVGWILIRFVLWKIPILPSWATLLIIERYIPYFAIGVAAYRVWCGARTWRDQWILILMALLNLAIIETYYQFYVNVCVLIMMVLLSDHKLGWLCQPPLLWLGAISYPLYLIHQFVGYALMVKLETMGLPVELNIFIALGSVLILATLIHHLIEKPSLSWLRRIWRNYKLRTSSTEPNNILRPFDGV
jgi:peptidoglycan/LPS O-acetylase OafA/YrhL